jgi:hypothetical protein
MQKVYVMIGKYHGENCTLGVFSSKAKANEAVAWLLENDMYYKSRPQDLGISTYELNGERIG